MHTGEFIQACSLKNFLRPYGLALLSTFPERSARDGSGYTTTFYVALSKSGRAKLSHSAALLRRARHFAKSSRDGQLACSWALW